LGAETVGVEYHQLRNYKAVSEAYEIAVRTANLSWTHQAIDLYLRNEAVREYDPYKRERWDLNLKRVTPPAKVLCCLVIGKRPGGDGIGSRPGNLVTGGSL